jgi:hypothetical protein
MQLTRIRLARHLTLPPGFHGNKDRICQLRPNIAHFPALIKCCANFAPERRSDSCGPCARCEASFIPPVFFVGIACRRPPSGSVPEYIRASLVRHDAPTPNEGTVVIIAKTSMCAIARNPPVLLPGSWSLSNSENSFPCPGNTICRQGPCGISGSIPLWHTICSYTHILQKDGRWKPPQQS